MLCLHPLRERELILSAGEVGGLTFHPQLDLKVRDHVGVVLGERPLWGEMGRGTGRPGLPRKGWQKAMVF